MAKSVSPDSKRSKISKAQQITMLEVLVTSLVLGSCLVLISFITKYIEFNTRIITEKSDAITAYDEAIRNIGICADTDKNGRLSDREIADCNPNTVRLEDVQGSLRYNIYEVMAQNPELESVARKRNAKCYDEEGNRYDFNQLYNVAETDKERTQLLQASKVCSALRVISDALPARKNTEALMASLNQLFIVSELDPENISPRDDKIELEDLTGVLAIPVSFSANGSGATIIRILDNVDRSIRNFDITSATIEWSKNGLSLQARANAYYLDETWGLESDKVVRASDKKTGSSKK